jgi:beta-lactamase regulating signal transducer with metallopeptidase domain
MTSVFITILNMSIAASAVALAVMLVRIPLRKSPKVFSYALWGVVLFRLVFPFSIDAAFSLMPTASNAIPLDIIYSQTPAIQTGILLVDAPINSAINTVVASANLVAIDPDRNAGVNQGDYAPANTATGGNPIQMALRIAGYIWLAGATIMLIYAVVGYIRLKRRVYYATLIRDNVYESDSIKTPFVLGFLSPKIYMPLGIEQQQYDYILKHEQTHIKRLDYLTKPLAFVVLSLHWFNPVIWVAYILMSKDMEMSCDEAVLKKTDADIRKDYSSSLLDRSIRKADLITPLAFGESNVKSRIKNVLVFKKPSTWLTIVSFMIVIVFLFTFASNRSSGYLIPDSGDLSLRGSRQTSMASLHFLSPPAAAAGDVMNASPETTGVEVVNDEVTNILRDMYDNSEYLHMQKVADWVYPFVNVNEGAIELLIALFNEYEWRANRTLLDFTASDIELRIEIYTPDMSRVLTLYGGYDIVQYRNRNDGKVAYYTYSNANGEVNYDLAEWLGIIVDSSNSDYVLFAVDVSEVGEAPSGR